MVYYSKYEQYSVSKQANAGSVHSPKVQWARGNDLKHMLGLDMPHLMSRFGPEVFAISSLKSGFGQQIVAISNTCQASNASSGHRLETQIRARGFRDLKHMSNLKSRFALQAFTKPNTCQT